MSMYDMMQGVNEFAPMLLYALGLDPRKVPRLRDCWFTGEEILVYTRTGGGNRATYAEEAKYLTEHPLYVRDEDDGYDETYAAYYFKLPPELADMIRARVTPDPRTPKERWEVFFTRLKNDEAFKRDQAERARPLFDQIFKHLQGDDDAEGKRRK